MTREEKTKPLAEVKLRYEALGLYLRLYMMALIGMAGTRTWMATVTCFPIPSTIY